MEFVFNRMMFDRWRLCLDGAAVDHWERTADERERRYNRQTDDTTTPSTSLISSYNTLNMCCVIRHRLDTCVTETY